MELWIAFTLAAAVFQTLRFALQKQLGDLGLSPLAATWTRFVVAAPVCLVVLGGAAWGGAELPALPPAFWLFVALASLGQVTATAMVMALFQRRNFDVGIAFKKTEVLQTALLGFVVLGDRLGLSALFAILGSGVAVVLLGGGRGQGMRFDGPSLRLGLGSGAFFALAGVGVRGATLEIPDADLWMKALVTLSAATTLQMVVLGGWLYWRERASVHRVAALLRPVSMTGAASLAGSYCWYSAFALQSAALVYAVGQVELLLSALVARFVFSQRQSAREAAGLTLLGLCLIWLTLSL